jgi:hypothetical protein
VQKRRKHHGILVVDLELRSAGKHIASWPSTFQSCVGNFRLKMFAYRSTAQQMAVRTKNLCISALSEVMEENSLVEQDESISLQDEVDEQVEKFRGWTWFKLKH